MAKVYQLPAELHVTISQGDAWRLEVDFDKNLTGYTIAASIHPKDGSADVVMAIEETSLVAGQFSIVLAAEQSAELAAAYHSWCLVMTPSGSPAEPRTYIAGRYIVEACK
jgi:hypothetical protein